MKNTTTLQSKRSITVLLGVLLYFSSLSAQTMQDTIIANFSLMERIPKEKLYLHLDKPFYGAGEKIWFKGYLVNATTHQDNSQSNFIITELINRSDSIVERKKIRRDSLGFHNAFTLPATLPAGDYYLRGYSNWMLNEDPDFFFSRNIKIGNSIDNTIVSSIEYQQEDDTHYTAKIKFTSNVQAVFENTTIKYLYLENGKIKNKGKKKTDENGWISISLPDLKSPAARRIEVEFDDPQYIYKRTFYLPVFTNDFDVKFFPEGGALLSIPHQNVAFKVQGADGFSKEVEGFAIGKEGKDITLMPWDFSYYSEQLKHIKYDLNDEMLRPYFEVNNTIKGVFGLATRLYGLHFTKNPKIPVYHPEVEAFEVTDNDGNYVGVIYTDFFPRDGKRAGAWMTEFKGQWKEENGKDSRPHVTIVMNFSRPTSDTPALLTYDEVETFLHEFGHALHGLLSDVTYASLSGTNVYRDFVELPSQFNENYLSEKEFLDSFAVHYKTGEKIPVELVEKIKKSSQYLAAYSCVRQLTFGNLDMAYHTITAPVDDAIAFEKAAIDKTLVLPDVEGTLIAPQFSHIFSGGYAAGYYGYKWAEVLDADAFSVFKANGIFDPVTATSFRDNILKRGGTENPMILYKRFKGSEPTIDALMRRDGIIK
jgi:hypothetical protein